MRPEQEILDDILDFVPVNDEWRKLDQLLDELWQHKPKIEWVPILLTFLDLYPNSDGNGVFWSLVHGLEAIDGYEQYLQHSAKSNPHEFKSILLMRCGMNT